MARVASVPLRPLVRRSSRFKQQRRFAMDTEREIALLHTLKAMTANGTPFDPPLTVVNAEQIHEEHRAGRGIFVATMHMVMAPMALRYLYDHGMVPYVVASTPIDILGTSAFTGMVAPSPESLMEFRRLLRSGEIIFAMIDAVDPGGNRLIEFESYVGTLRIRDTLIRVAERCDAAIFFTAGRLEPDGGITVTLQRAGAEPVAEFVAFVREHARG